MKFKNFYDKREEMLPCRQCGGTAKKRLMEGGLCPACVDGARLARITRHYKRLLNAGQ